MERSDWKNTFGTTPLSFHTKVQSTLDGLQEKKEPYHMRRKGFTFKKAAVFAIVATLGIGTTVFAAGKIAYQTSSSNRNTEFTSMPSHAQIKEKCGFDAKYVSDFENGYVFVRGAISDTAGYDSDNNKVASAKNLSLTYQNKQETVTLSVMGSLEDDMSEQKGQLVSYKGSNLYYQSQDYKFEPENYQMTAQDKADEAAGTYVFSFGSDKEEISNIQSLIWTDNGQEYLLQAADSSLNQKAMVLMAQQIIDTELK